MSNELFDFLQVNHNLINEEEEENPNSPKNFNSLYQKSKHRKEGYNDYDILYLYGLVFTIVLGSFIYGTN